MRLLRLRLLRRLRHRSLNLRRHLHLRPHLRRLQHQHQLLNLRLHLRPSLSLRLRQLHNRRLHRPLDQPRRLQLQRERRSRQMFRTNFCHQLCVV